MKRPRWKQRGLFLCDAVFYRCVMTMTPHTVILGVDGGGSSCRVALGTAQNGVIARATGGPANVFSDFAQTVETVTATIKDAADQADLSDQQLSDAHIHLGLAGVMTPQDSDKVASALPFQNITVTDDRPTALHGALGEQDGFLLSIGTGTVIAAQTNGVFRSVGGWGLSLGDEGSGAWLGLQALRQVLRCHDGLADHSDLTRDLLGQFQTDPNQIVTFSAAATPSDYGQFAPTVMSYAKGDDPIAYEIVQTGVTHLRASLSALGFAAGNTLCLTGGVGPHYQRFFAQRDRANIIAPCGTALDGAFDMARLASEPQQKASR